jgi:DNA-binding NtrC family response regulator
MSEPQQNEEKQQSKVGSGVDAEIVPLAEMERQAIVDALLQVKGDKPEAARRLGIGKSTLYRKLKRYGLTQ